MQNPMEPHAELYGKPHANRMQKPMNRRANRIAKPINSNRILEPYSKPHSKPLSEPYQNAMQNLYQQQSIKYEIAESTVTAEQSLV